MKIATLSKNGIVTGDHVIIVSKQECQNMIDIVSYYCDNNKRKTNAKKLLKQFENELACY